MGLAKTMISNAGQLSRSLIGIYHIATNKIWTVWWEENVKKITSFCRVFKRCTQKNWFLFLLHGANVIADYYLLVNVEYQSVRACERERDCCAAAAGWPGIASSPSLARDSRRSPSNTGSSPRLHRLPWSRTASTHDALRTGVIVGDTTRTRTPTHSLELRYSTPHF